MALRSLRRRSFVGWGLTLPFVTLVSGCVLPGSEAPPRQFGLSPLAPHQPAATAGWSLAVAPPRALQVLDTTRIAHRPGHLELQYYAGAAWQDRAPTMIQMLIIRSFQNDSRLQVVSDDAPGPPAEFLLTSILQDFESEQSADGGRAAHVTLVAALTPTTRRQQAQTQSFEAVAPAADDSMAAIVAAFDQAMTDVLGKLVAWTLATGGSLGP